MKTIETFLLWKVLKMTVFFCLRSGHFISGHGHADVSARVHNCDFDARRSVNC